MFDDALSKRRYEHYENGGVIVKRSRTIWEAGHYYRDFGPTRWSLIGWEISTQLRDRDDPVMLLIDDVHSRDEVHRLERCESVISFPSQLCPDLMVNESAVAEDAFNVLERLKRLSKRKRARLTWRPRRWSCSGLSLTTSDGRPLCLLFDLGLTWHKYSLGFQEVVNVLPFFYEPQQRGLVRIAKKIMPDLKIKVVLYDLDGQWYLLDTE